MNEQTALDKFDKQRIVREQTGLDFSDLFLIKCAMEQLRDGNQKAADSLASRPDDAERFAKALANFRYYVEWSDGIIAKLATLTD